MSRPGGLRARLAAVRREYEGGQGEERPLGGFLALMGVYTGAVGGAALLARATGRHLPERVGAGDVLLLALATHKASRLLSKDAVTSPLRAPFTRFAGSAGEGEVMEEVRGHGLAHSTGELLTCPFCTSVWVATGFTAGGVLAPRLTRSALVTLTAVLGSDVLHLLYDSAKHLPALAERAAAGPQEGDS
ncbi:uncharacterized protein DUF1360 [Kineococcus xinjiangensis]|uniref:Uncharacterized protein DUF1360 n=1 Tax=Kineococcus xinjiangensis TaxID=512762 RepID=A0A2S6IPY1_9ACTN|nr:DUF1360 domain-containing protein [Kineococcus xinjiangensis]PPK96156.1 uncharacterized protein DUF1360 [Kineococcus xinjiangensis]